MQNKMSRIVTKPTKWHVRPAKTQISLGIRLVWSESSLSTWKKLGSLATHWAHSEDSDQTGRMPRLIWVFAGRTVTLLVLSWGDSNLAEYFAFSIQRWVSVIPYNVCNHLRHWMNSQNYIFRTGLSFYLLSDVLKISLFSKKLWHIRYLGSFWTLAVQYMSQRIK